MDIQTKVQLKLLLDKDKAQEDYKIQIKTLEKLFFKRMINLLLLSLIIQHKELDPSLICHQQRLNLEISGALKLQEVVYSTLLLHNLLIQDLAVKIVLNCLVKACLVHSALFIANMWEIKVRRMGALVMQDILQEGIKLTISIKMLLCCIDEIIYKF